MSDDLIIQIIAKDGSTQVFQRVSNGAQKMGRDVEQAGVRGQRAFQELRVGAAALGAATVAASGILSNWSRDLAESEGVTARLQAAIEATGDSFADFENAIAAAGNAAVEMAFDDDDAFEALNRLTVATGSTQTALSNLNLVMDFARARNIDLATAADVVGKALQGNTSLLSRYGVTVAEGATATEALAALQAKVAGQADAYASTTAGFLDRTRVELQNFKESIAAHAGGLQELLVLLPGLSAGYTAVGGVVGALSPRLRELSGVSFLGPIGLVAAAGAATLGIVKLADALTYSYDEAASDAKIATDTLADSLTDLAAAGDPRALLGVNWTNALNTAFDGLLDLQDRIDALTLERANLENEQPPSEAGLARRRAIEAELAELTALADQYGGTRQLLIDFADANNDLNAILTNQGVGAERARAVTESLFVAWGKGDLLLTDLIYGLDRVQDLLGEYDLGALRATKATDDLAAAQDELTTAMRPGTMRDQTAALDEATRAHQEWARTLPETDYWMVQQERHAAALNDIYGIQAEQTDAVAGSTDRLGGSLATTGTIAANWTEKLNEATAAAIAFVAEADNIDDVLLAAGAALSGDQGLIRVSQDIDRSRQQLESLFGVIVGGTQNLGRPIQQLADFSDALTGPGKRFGEIDRALSTGRISVDEYNAALAANTRISENNEAAQAHLAAIQAKQLPFLASYADAYEDYLETLVNLPAAEQRHALALADAGERAKIANAYSVAYAASLGEIPEDVATDIIVSDAQADPVLKEMLEEYGLIEEGANGEIKVNFDDGPTLTTTLTTLNDTLATLIAYLDDLDGKHVEATVEVETPDQPIAAKAPEAALPSSIPIAFVGDMTGMQDVFDDATTLGETFGEQSWTANFDGDGTKFNKELGAVMGDGTNFDKSARYVGEFEGDATGYDQTLDRIKTEGEAFDAATYTATLDLVDYASAALDHAKTVLDGLDGRVATTYVNTVTTGGDFFGFRHGGVIGADAPPAAPATPIPAPLPRAQHGAIGRGRMVTVGEDGPEAVVLPVGAYVRPAPATAATRGGGDGGVHLHGPIYFVVNTPDLYGTIRDQLISQARR